MSKLHNLFVIRRSLFFLSALFAWFCSCEAEDYFVSPNGLDDHSGQSPNEPLQTISKAVSLISPGDTIHLMEGTYPEEIDFSNFSNSSDPVTTIKAYDGAHVVWGGFDRLEELVAVGADWQLHEGNIYKIQLSELIWQLFVDDSQMVPARWPNARWDDGSWWLRDTTMATGGTLDANGIQYDTPTNGNSLAEDIDFSLQGGVAVLNVGSWKTYARSIESHTASSDHFTYPAIDNTYKTKTSIHRFWVEGVLPLLDAELEWFLDTDSLVLYLWAPGGVKPTGNIYGKVREFALTLDQSHNIHIDGIRFEGTSLKGTNSDGLRLENCSFYYPTFNRRMLKDTGDIPIMTFLNTDNASFMNCKWEHVEGTALDLGGADNLIENCLFHDIDWSCANIPGLGLTLNLNGARGTVRYVTINKTGASSTIKLGGQALIEYCDISETGFLQNDGSTIQVTKLDQKDTIIRYNWDHDTIKKGIRFDTTNDGTFGYDGTVNHNVTFRVGSQGIHLKGDRHKMVNNTSFDNASNDIVMNFDFVDENINSTTKNNAANQISGDRNNDKVLPGIVEANWDGTDEGLDIKSLLRDVGNFDFRPKEGSILVDAGVIESGLSPPYVGSAPDIGAYEFGDDYYWIPGFRDSIATFPIPADGANAVYQDTAIIWRPAYKAIGHRLYMGPSPDNLVKIEAFTNGNIHEPHGLEANRTYYWRVDAIQSDGSTRKGQVWSFDTNSGGEDFAYTNWQLNQFDSEEIANGLADPDQDPDLDHLSNYSEFIAQTNPNDVQSVLSVDINAVAFDQLKLTFQPVVGQRLYRILSSQDLVSWNIEDISQSELSDGNILITWNGNPFYKVEVIR